MPLMQGKSKAVVGKNIKEMMASGHPQKQAVAAAMQKAGMEKKKKRRGPAPMSAMGNMAMNMGKH